MDTMASTNGTRGASNGNGSASRVTASSFAAAQEDTFSTRDPGRSSTDTKAKRKSYGQTGTDQATLTRASGRVLSQSQHANIRKQNSGPFRVQHDFLTSESEHESSTQSHQLQDRARSSIVDDSTLVSELEAVKARVLEMERENRSHLDFCQSPQVTISQGLDNGMVMEQLSSPSDKRRSTQRYLGSGTSGESSGEISRPTLSIGTSMPREKLNGTLGRAASAAGNTFMGRTIDSPTRTSPKVSAQQPIQHLNLLQEAFGTFEKTMMAMGGSDATSAVQDMSKVVSHAIAMNQTIRGWIKTDVSQVDSSSMHSFQALCDDQIRRLTRSLWSMARLHSSADRSPTQLDNVSGSMGMERSYLSTQSTGSQRLGHSQRLSLPAVGGDHGARAGFDHNVSYSARSSFAAPSTNYEPMGSVTPNGMSSGYWARTGSVAAGNVTTIDTRSRPDLRRAFGSDYGHDRSPRYNNSVQGISRQLHASMISSRDPSPPEGYDSAIQNAPPPPLDFSRTLSPSHGRVPQSPGGPAGMESALMARRQANVRDIMAKYSRSGPRSPTFDHSRQEQDMSRISQVGFPHDGGIHYRHEQSQEAMFDGNQHQQRQYLLERQYQRGQYAPENVMTASVEFSSTGRPRAVSPSRRPLSQQDHHGYSGSGTSHARRGSIIQRSGRYAHDNVFSEDESIGGLEAWKLDRLPGRKSESFAIRVQQIQGRGRDQLQPLHQQLEQFRHDEHAGGHYEEDSQQQQQAQLHGGYMDVAEQDLYHPLEGETPSFAQRRPQPRDTIQRQQRELEDFRHQRNVQRQSTKHHHQDMMMATPAMPSPNSSPSSSSRVDAQSVVLSNGYQGTATSINIDGRYNLSPRESVDTPTLRRQQSMNTFNDRNHQTSSEMHNQSLQSRRPMSLAHRRGHL